MKILYLSPTRFPTERAHGVQIAHMCAAFSAHGNDVVLAAPNRKNPVTVDPFTYYKIPKTFAVKYTWAFPWGVSMRFGFFTQLLVYVLQAPFLIRRYAPELVYTRDEFVALFVSFFVSAEKIIWESHEAKYNFAVKALFKKGIKCVAISDGIKRFYTKHGVCDELILIAHDGIDESFFGPVETKEEARSRLGIVTDKPVAMYIGGLDKWKGVETFLEASQNHDAVLYAVIGGRPEEITQYKVKYPKVLFLGSRPYNELKHNQQAADVLVVPNTANNDLSAQYTSPLKLFAHMTAKVPLVVSDVPSIRDVVSEEEVWFFEADNNHDMCSVIKKVLGAGESVAQKRFNVFKKAKEYTWSARVQRILRYILSLRV